MATEPAAGDREQRILRCRMQGNTHTQISFPDRFRIGSVVKHHGNPFIIRFGLQGSVVGLSSVFVRWEMLSCLVGAGNFQN